MASKVECKTHCKESCPCGFFNKRIFGITLGIWLIVFAILPHSAKGIAWTAQSVSELWRSGVKAVGVEKRMNRDRGQFKGIGDPDWIKRGRI